MIRDLWGDERAIGEDRQKETLVLGVGIDVQKVPAGERLTSGEGELQAALLMDFVQDADDFFITQFLPDLLGSIEGIRIAHHAFKVATAGHFPLAGQGEGFSLKPLKELLAPDLCAHLTDLLMICHSQNLSLFFSFSPGRSFGNGLDRPKFLELTEKSEKILFQLFRGGIEFFEQQLFDLLDRSSAINQLPDPGPDFIEDKQPVFSIQLMGDRNQKKFIGDLAGDEPFVAGVLLL